MRKPPFLATLTLLKKRFFFDLAQQMVKFCGPPAGYLEEIEDLKQGPVKYEVYPTGFPIGEEDPY